MNLSNSTYNRHVTVNDNPEDLQAIHTIIDGLNKADVIAYFPGMSISSDFLYFLPERGGLLNSRKMLKSGYQCLLAKLGIPMRVAEGAPGWVEIPLVNGKITSLCQQAAQRMVTIRTIDNEVRAVLSASYTAIDDKEIISLLEESFLQRISGISFTCSHTDSRMHINTRQAFTATYNGYITDMFLYISNSEIGDASVRCGIGISILKESNPERRLHFELIKDTRTLGRVIHRGEAIKRLGTQVENLFTTANSNWDLLQVALRKMSDVEIEALPSLEEKIIKALKEMPEFEVWKTQYDEMRKTSQITNVFDLIYLMTSIPYRDEYFNNVVEEILYGRFF